MNDETARRLIETYDELRQVCKRAASQMDRWLMEMESLAMETSDLGEFDNRVRDWLRHP